MFDLPNNFACLSVPNVSIPKPSPPTADDLIEILVRELKAFQSRLLPNQELMINASGFVFRLEELRHNKETLMYFGTTPQGSPVELVQHYHQSSVLFFAAQKRVMDKPAVRIGFQ